METSLAQGLTIHDSIGWFMRVVAQRYKDAFVQAPRVERGVPTGGLSFRLLIGLTADGQWLQFSQTTDQLFRAMMRMFDLEWMLSDPEWRSAPDFEDIAKRIAFWERLLAVVRSKTASEWAQAFDRDSDVWGERPGQSSGHAQLKNGNRSCALLQPDALHGNGWQATVLQIRLDDDA